MERRQRVAVWLAFLIGFALAALLQLPGEATRRSAAAGDRPRPALAIETPMAPPHTPLGASVAAVAMRHGLSPSLVLAIIEAESGFDPAALSPKGAMGLMQILPETAALMGLPEPADPASNLEAGCRYLAALLDIFGGDVELALAAYNAGPGAVRRWGTVPPYRETRAFIRRVSASYRAATGLDVWTATRLTSDTSAFL